MPLPGQQVAIFIIAPYNALLRQTNGSNRLNTIYFVAPLYNNQARYCIVTTNSYRPFQTPQCKKYLQIIYI